MPVVDARGALVGILAADDLLDLLAEELSGLARTIVNEQRREAQLRAV
jgi:Mg/Co/Ni transporter MgtE